MATQAKIAKTDGKKKHDVSEDQAGIISA